MEDSLIPTLGQGLTAEVKWAELKVAARNRAYVRVPKSAIRRRPGRGGQIWEYLDVGWLEEKLDEEVPGWSFQVQEIFQIPAASPVAVVVHAALTFVTSGLLVRREDVGGSVIKVGKEGPVSVADDFKAATTDAFRRCCFRSGLARGWRRKLSEKAGEVEEEIATLMAHPYFQEREEEIGRYYEKATRDGRLEAFLLWLRKEKKDEGGG